MNFKEFWVSRKCLRAPRDSLNTGNTTATDETIVEIKEHGAEFVHPNLICHLRKNKISSIPFNAHTSLPKTSQTLEKATENGHIGVESNLDYVFDKVEYETLKQIAFSLLEEFAQENPNCLFVEQDNTKNLEMDEDTEKYINYCISKINNFPDFENTLNENIFNDIDIIENSKDTPDEKEFIILRKCNMGEKDIRECRKCDKIFMDKRQLMDHKKSHDKEVFICSHCYKTFRSQNNLETHQSKHKENIKISDEKSSTNNHGLEIHDVRYTSKAMCSVCDKIFKTERGLKAHSRRMHAEETYLKCEKCEKQFNTYSYLRWRKHTTTLACSRRMFSRKVRV